MKQDETRVHSLGELIADIESFVSEPYSAWKIGVGNSKGMDDEGCIGTIVLNPNNDPAVLGAYNYFKERGMTAKQPLPRPAKYIYIFHDKWTKNIEVNF